LSVAAKLYVIFGLLAALTMALATISLGNARHHATLIDELESAMLGAGSAEQVNNLVHTVLMDARRSESASADITRGIETSPWFPIAIGGAAILLAGLGATVIRRAVARPLAEMTRAAREVAEGAHTAAVPYRGRNDEFGELARSIGVLQEAMRRNEELKRGNQAAEGRARRQERISQEISRFSADIEATLRELGHISEQMLTASAQFSEAAERAATRTANATGASKETANNMHYIASAVEELVASMKEIDRQVVQSNKISTEAVAETERTSNTVKGLDEAATRVANIIKLIGNIAEQTNMLALNATIEAARAGSAGRGFAIVAGEVKGLAGQTAKATKDISSQVDAMQGATLRSIYATAAIEKTIGQLGEISGTIVKALAAQGAATQQIAGSADIAARHTAETANEIKRLGEATAGTHATATEVKTVAHDLNRVTGRIRGQIEQFFQRLQAA
jgi:methyl-accepting chemotaxis protein